jgi:hypothetical protein
MSERYAVDLERRFAQFTRQIAKDLQQLKQLSMMLEPGCLVTPYTGTIDAGYTSGRPLVDLPSGAQIGPCPYLSSYTPAAGDTVLLVPSGQTYYVVGKFI